jgi:hypothetical protein
MLIEVDGTTCFSDDLEHAAGTEPRNLVTNAVVTWNTVHMAAVIDRLRYEARAVKEEDIARLSPACYEHINPYGKYRFRGRGGVEPLPVAAALPAC